MLASFELLLKEREKIREVKQYLSVISCNKNFIYINLILTISCKVSIISTLLF